MLVSPNKEIILVNNKSNLLKTLIQFHSYVSINKTNQMYQNKINKGYLLLSNKMIDNIHRKYSESLKYKQFLKSLKSLRARTYSSKSLHLFATEYYRQNYNITILNFLSVNLF